MLSTFTFCIQIDYGNPSAGIFLHQPKPTDKNISGYSKGAWIITHNQNIGLKEGVNTITLTLDTENKEREADETNNVYKFKVTLKP